jgi:hypothetical protein
MEFKHAMQAGQLALEIRNIELTLASFDRPDLFTKVRIVSDTGVYYQGDDPIIYKADVIDSMRIRNLIEDILKSRLEQLKKELAEL